MLLAELAAIGPSVGLDLSVSYLHDEGPGPSADRLCGLGIDPVLVQTHKLLSLSDHRAVRRHLARVEPDVVHTHLRSADFFGGVAARTLGLPVVSTIHGVDWNRPGRREKIRNELVKLARRRLSRRIVTVCDALRSSYLAASGDADHRVVTIHNGSARRAVPGTGMALRAELGLDARDVVLVMVSVLLPVKAHDVALDAVARLREDFPRLRLVIVGEGPARPAIERAARSLGDTVRLTGFRGDVMEILDAADVLIHPSRADAFPMTLVEAIAAGLPVVSTRVGGIPEIVGEDSGLLIESPPSPEALADAVATLLSDADLRRRMAAAGQRRFEAEFTAERWATKLRTLYESVLPAETSSLERRHGSY
jgi:glycosyltransferase involved in cell wall biosynthesis